MCFRLGMTSNNYLCIEYSAASKFVLLPCRVRLSLGLKPLQVEKTADKERAAHAAAVAAKAEEQRKAEEAAMADHIKE